MSGQQRAARLTDLLEIAAYVYAADCSTQRGKKWTDGDSTEPWGRDLSFVIAVREPDFWGSRGISSLLTEVLNFLSNDRYSFTFVPLKYDRSEQEYFEFGDPKDWPFHQPDRVVVGPVLYFFMCLRMVSDLRPLAIFDLAICCEYHTSDISGRCFTRNLLK